MPEIDLNDPRPPYRQIADDLRLAIQRGKLRTGQRMASNRELATEYGVAPMTVHQAIRVLRDEGLVESYQGRGVFVSDPTTNAVARLDPAGRLTDLSNKVDLIADQLDEGGTNLEALRREVAEVKAHLIELYARTGHQYPRDQKAAQPPSKARRASGA